MVSLNSRLESNREEEEKIFQNWGARLESVHRNGLLGGTDRGFRVEGSGFRFQGSSFRVQGSGFKVQGSRFRVQGTGFRVQGEGLKV